MTFTTVCALSALIPGAAYILSAVAHAHARRHRLLDLPTLRSAHSLPIPTGGGVGFAAVVMLAYPLWRIMAGEGRESGLSGDLLLGGGLLVFSGWLDDRKGLPILPRLLVQILAWGWCVAGMGGGHGMVDGMVIGSCGFAWSMPLKLFFLVSGLWLINAYNFMDGLDGLAAAVAIGVGLFGAVLFWGLPMAAPLLLASLAVLGFLPWNWPPAKMFMGDAGSGFLGFLFALAWLHTSGQRQGFLIWPILLAVFIVDATLTLLGRMRRGEKWYESHSSHVYQLAGKRWGHKKVLSAVVAILVLWLLPCAVFCRIFPSWAPAFALAAYIPVGIAYFVFRKRLGRENKFSP